MRFLKYLCLTAAAGCLFLVSAPRSHAQIAVTIGAAPVCPYGYYDYAPEAYYSPYYPYYEDYYARDDYLLARPAFRPGCGAGKPHC